MYSLKYKCDVMSVICCTLKHKVRECITFVETTELPPNSHQNVVKPILAFTQSKEKKSCCLSTEFLQILKSPELDF